jgi:NAD(P)-dependent dehydrogenase (short-subunit alcohol dehydrogenase family)
MSSPLAHPARLVYREMGRVAQPEEIAPVYVYLASDADSSYTAGEIIAVTGGLTTTR